MKWKRSFKFYLLRLFRLHSETNKIALGIAIGFLPNWIPTFGFGPLLSVALAKVFRGNAVGALVGGVAGTTAWPVLFLLNYKVGAFLLKHKNPVYSMDDVEYMDMTESIIGWDVMGLQFLVGTMVNCVISTVILYTIFYVLFQKYRIVILAKVKKLTC